MTIYEDVIQQVSNGAKFSVDFKTKTIKVNNTPIIECGVYAYDKKLISTDEQSTHDILSKIEQLYESYRYSIPSERSSSIKNNYFKALKAEEMTDDELCTGINREVARVELEAYILCMVLNGKLKWNTNNWFWQSKISPDLIILKEWIEG